tara:strand:- start:282 stop:434 length:153 start_codon:yes stop_codon:yes gene_type:complete
MQKFIIKIAICQKVSILDTKTSHSFKDKNNPILVKMRDAELAKTISSIKQ